MRVLSKFSINKEYKRLGYALSLPEENKVISNTNFRWEIYKAFGTRKNPFKNHYQLNEYNINEVEEIFINEIKKLSL
jgi:hypothetical protein